MKRVIWTIIPFFAISAIAIAVIAREPYHYRSRYSSSSVRDKYGKTIGRIETRTNSAAKYENYRSLDGKTQYSIRTPITGPLSSQYKPTPKPPARYISPRTK